MIPRVSLSLVFVKFGHFKIFGERGHVQCSIKWIGANILKRILFAFAPNFYINYLLNQGLYNACEIWGWWRLRCVGLLMDEVLEIGWCLMLEVLGDRVLVLWGGVLVELCEMLLVSMDLLENMRRYLRIGIMMC